VRKPETAPLLLHGVSFRHEARPPDVEHVRGIVEATGYFTASEIPVAVELVQENLAKGEAASGYSFIFAELDGRTIGYTCFGLTPCTVSSYTLYWIAVHPEYQGKGLGKALMRETEKRVRAVGGTRIYIDTSYKAQYNETRAFYKSLGYRLGALLPDYYAPGDDKVIYVKVF
jgi:ribosomal protein S18 acetylase RimI-like enzyme